MIADDIQDVFKVLPLATVEGVFTVAVGTTQRASGQADKYGGQAGLQGFTLEGMENLGDFQHALAGVRLPMFLGLFCHLHIVRLTGLTGQFSYVYTAG